MHQRTTRTVLLIAGMRGNECRERIAAALEIVAGVKEVAVNLYRARATIVHGPPCEAPDLVRAVIRAGYGAALDGGGLASRIDVADGQGTGTPRTGIRGSPK